MLVQGLRFAPSAGFCTLSAAQFLSALLVHDMKSAATGIGGSVAPPTAAQKKNVTNFNELRKPTGPTRALVTSECVFWRFHSGSIGSLVNIGCSVGQYTMRLYFLVPSALVELLIEGQRS
jgi:hypothetical protein